MIMFGGCLTIHDWDGALLAEVHCIEGRLYLLKLKVEDNCLLTKADDNSSRLWHLKYGHLNYHFLKKMATKKLVEGLPPITLPTQLCHSCLAGKQCRIPFPKMIIFRENGPLELVFADICGPIIPPTLGGNRFLFLSHTITPHLPRNLSIFRTPLSRSSLSPDLIFFLVITSDISLSLDFCLQFLLIPHLLFH